MRKLLAGSGMAQRYFFTVHDDQVRPDTIGGLHADLSSALAEAKGTLADLMHDLVRDLGDSIDWKLVVTDSSGRAVATLSLRASVVMAGGGFLRKGMRSYLPHRW